jgi:type IV secretion system protein VirB4
MIDLKKYQKINTKPSSSELLPYFSLTAEDLVRLKDEGLMALWKIEGIDSEMFDQSMFDYYSDKIEDSLKALNDNYTVQFFLIRKKNHYYPSAKFKSEVSAFIDTEHQKHIEKNQNYINHIYFSITYREKKSKLKIFKKLFIKDDEKLTDKIKKAFSESKTKEEVLRELKERIRIFSYELDRLFDNLKFLGIKKLKAEELLASLYFIINPAEDLKSKITLPDYCFLDEYLTDFNIDSSYEEAIALKHNLYKVLSFKDYPVDTYPVVLDGLLSLDQELKFSMSYSFTDKAAANSEIKKRRRHYWVARKTMLHQVSETATGEETQLIDPTKMSYVYDAEEAMQELDLVRPFGVCSVNFISWAKTEKQLDENVSQINSVLTNKAYQSLVETLNKLPAFLSSIPAGEKINPRKFILSLGNFIDYMPFRTILSGETYNAHLRAPALTLFETKHKTLYYFNFHVKDVGHAVMFGPNGTGKSVILNFLVSQYMKYDPQVFFFDYGYTAEILCLAQKGLHIDFIPDKKTFINPVSLIISKNGKNFLRDFLQVLIESFGYIMNDEDLKQLWKAIELVSNLPKNKHVLETFSSILPVNLADKLRPWVFGEYKNYFNNAVDMLNISQYTVFEMSKLTKNEKVIAPLLMYLFERIQSSLNTNIPSIIVLDESWFYLQHPIFAVKITEWLQTLRKLNTLVFFATQSMTHVAANPLILSSVIDNVTTKIFLPNPRANTDDMKHMYINTFGLSENEYNMVIHATQKRDYFIKQESVSRLGQLNLNENIISLIQSDEYSRRLAKAVEMQGDNNWYLDYIEHWKKRTPLAEVEDLSKYFA